ncbi:CBS domain-containing protein [Hyphomicrobiales bacterium]|uniref:CBS domain-containing protein n=1 Tax=Mycoplana sp. MJR14 TaxID=3032583 RepID=UPI000DD9DC51
MRIEDLNAKTTDRLMVIDLHSTLQAAARALSEPRMGLAIVSDTRGRAMGVLSKSDIIRHIALERSASVSAVDIMSRDIIACQPDDDLQQVWRTMAQRSLQNMPVLGSRSEPLGVLAFDDATKALYEQEALEEQILVGYIAGIGYR